MRSSLSCKAFCKNIFLLKIVLEIYTYNEITSVLVFDMENEE